ncbi:MAG: tetratricopeptide repeat protein, partial [Candidatus Limnocylindria bacterium]
VLGRPLLSRRDAWPRDRAGERDDVARAVSSLRDLEFARAAGTIDAADHSRLRALLERDALAPPQVSARPEGAPVLTIALAALAAGSIAVAVALTLPAAPGDRAPGVPITGTGGGLITPTTAQLEARVRADPGDVPTQLQLADAYLAEERLPDAVAVYRAVLTIDARNVVALNRLGLILFRSGSPEGAEVAADRVLALRPRDPDALFLKGLIRYGAQDDAGAIAAWGVYLEVAGGDYAAGMVRTLYEEARRRGGR